MEELNLLKKIIKAENEWKFFENESDLDEQFNFLIEYSIKKDPKPNDVLKRIHSKIHSESKYYEIHPNVEKMKTILQERYRRFLSLLSRDPNAFNKKFFDFLEWWYDNKQECYYCKVSSNTLNFAFDDKNGESIIFSEKPSFSGNLQIDKKNPKNGYNKENCVFACVLCNNAKSDMISSKKFKQIIAPSIAEYWKSIEKDKKN